MIGLRITPPLKWILRSFRPPSCLGFRLNDQYLGLHLTPDSTNTELFEYQRAQDQLQSQRAVRYRELNDLSNSLLERISRKNLSDPDSVRSSIRRINRIYSVLGLSQEAGLLTGRITALLIGSR